jgi:hypothetical protein
MTEQERTARLEGILEAWNRVLDGHDEEMRELRTTTAALRTDMDSLRTNMAADMAALRSEMAHMPGWIVGGVAVMAIFTALNAVD